MEMALDRTVYRDSFTLYSWISSRFGHILSWAHRHWGNTLILLYTNILQNLKWRNLIFRCRNLGCQFSSTHSQQREREMQLNCWNVRRVRFFSELSQSVVGLSWVTVARALLCFTGIYYIYNNIYNYIYICFCMLSRVGIYLTNGMPLTRLCLLAFLWQSVLKPTMASLHLVFTTLYIEVVLRTCQLVYRQANHQYNCNLSLYWAVGYLIPTTYYGSIVQLMVVYSEAGRQSIRRGPLCLPREMLQLLKSIRLPPVAIY